MHELIELLKADSNSANAVGAIASAFIAFFSLFISILSIIISLWALKIQRRHNVLSVRPLPEVTVADYENSLRVKIRNNGTGPIIILGLDVFKGDLSKPAIIEWMPSLGMRTWTNFTHALVNRSLPPGSELILLELNEFENESNFSYYRTIVREALSPLCVFVRYTDIYNSQLPAYSKKLEWFGRHTAA